MAPRRRTRRTLLLALACSVVAGVLTAGIALPAVGGIGLAVRTGARAFNSLPADFTAPKLPVRSTVYAADGSVIAHFYFEDRVQVTLAQIAPVMRQAIVAIEDSRFYAHGALDVIGTLRALNADVGSGAVRQGGSTLTQQYVKNALVEEALASAHPKQEIRAATKDTLGRKLREARYAVAVENRLSKDQILTRYLNIVYFGDGAHGIYTAAKHYFSVPPWKLSLPQAATLAGIVEDPARYDPRLHPKQARERRNTVLARMAQTHEISSAAAQQAMQTPLGLHLHPMPNGCAASGDPFFCDYVLHAVARLPALGRTRAERIRRLLRGGLAIHTTLVPQVQHAAAAALAARAPASSPYGAAEALVQPGTGRIEALAVNRPYGTAHGHTEIDLAVGRANGGGDGFHSGSTFKIFTLAAALSKGLTPAFTMNAPPVLHNPSGFTTCSGQRLDYGGHDVHNAATSDAGTQTLAHATWNSVNTFFVKLETKIGLCEPVRIARALGMHQGNGTPIHQYPSFTLGVFDVSPLDLANAYATFAAGGRYCPPTAITSIVDRNGHHLPVPQPKCRQALPAGIAHTVSAVLSGVIAHGTGTGAAIGRPAAGKTGTVGNYSAAWFCGYVPQLASCVWFGFPAGAQGRQLTNITVGGIYYHHVYGASIPAPIWGQTMRSALRGVPVRPLS